MKNETGESLFVKLAYLLIIISIIMVIPPVLMGINSVALKNQFLFGLPLMYLWYYGWFTLMILCMIAVVSKSKKWDGDLIEKRLNEFLKKEGLKNGKVDN